MPNKAHEPTDKLRGKVEALAGYGINQEAIAEEIGISKKTLKKYYENELAFGVPRMNARVAQTLYGIAVGTNGREPDKVACMFWLKTRAGWRETSHHEHSGKLTLTDVIESVTEEDLAEEE